MNPTLLLFSCIFSLYLLGCQSAGNEKDHISDTTDSAANIGLTPDTNKLVKTGIIRLKVKDITKSTRSLSTLAHKFGGLIFDQNLDYEETARNELPVSTDSLIVITAILPHADITVKVPSENIEEFMYEATELGYFTSSRKMHIDDQSLRYLENVLKRKNRNEVLSEPTQQKKNSFTRANVVVVKDQVIEQEIGNRAINADVRYSTVTLSLFQNALITREVIVNNAVLDYQLPFLQRFSNALKTGWEYFVAFILMLAHMWLFILLGLAVYLSYRSLKPRVNLPGLNVKSR